MSLKLSYIKPNQEIETPNTKQQTGLETEHPEVAKSYRTQLT